jgi:nucleoside-diphosphate kinase
MERTLVIIKPDAYARNYTGKIFSIFEENGLKIKALKALHLNKQQAQEFYQVHKERHFFDSLTSYISSGPVVAAVLEGEGAINKVRQLLGATDPKEAASGTIRALFGQNREQNATHGSDSAESAAFEIPFFFNKLEIIKSDAND